MQDTEVFLLKAIGLEEPTLYEYRGDGIRTHDPSVPNAVR